MIRFYRSLLLSFLYVFVVPIYVGFLTCVHNLQADFVDLFARVITRKEGNCIMFLFAATFHAQIHFDNDSHRVYRMAHFLVSIISIKNKIWVSRHARWQYYCDHHSASFFEQFVIYTIASRSSILPPSSI